MATIEHLRELLEQALREPLQRTKLIARFQAIVWKGLDPDLPNELSEVLRDLAYDFDFFDARADVRSEDDTLYGHKRLERELREALEKLRPG